MEIPAAAAAADSVARAQRTLPPSMLFKSRREWLLRARAAASNSTQHPQPPPRYSLSLALPPDMLECKSCKETIRFPERDLFVFSECRHSYHFYCAANLSMMTADCRSCLDSTRKDKQRLLGLLPAHLDIDPNEQ